MMNISDIEVFDHGQFFKRVYNYSSKGEEVADIVYGLGKKAPHSPFIFQSYPDYRGVFPNFPTETETDEKLRCQMSLRTFTQHYIRDCFEMDKTRFVCKLDGKVLASEELAAEHMISTHREKFISAIDFLVEDKELDHMAFTFTKLLYGDLIYYPTFVNPRKVDHEFPSVVAPLLAQPMSTLKKKSEKKKNKKLVKEEHHKDLGEGVFSLNNDQVMELFEEIFQIKPTNSGNPVPEDVPFEKESDLPDIAHETEEDRRKREAEILSEALKQISKKKGKKEKKKVRFDLPDEPEEPENSQEYQDSTEQEFQEDQSEESLDFGTTTSGTTKKKKKKNKKAKKNQKSPQDDPIVEQEEPQTGVDETNDEAYLNEILDSMEQEVFSEVLEEVILELLPKLVNRGLQEIRKEKKILLEKQEEERRKAEQEARLLQEKEEEKQRKNAERKNRRDQKIQETEYWANVIIDEVLVKELTKIFSEIKEEQRIRSELLDLPPAPLMVPPTTSTYGNSKYSSVPIAENSFAGAGYPQQQPYPLPHPHRVNPHKSQWSDIPYQPQPQPSAPFHNPAGIALHSNTPSPSQPRNFPDPRTNQYKPDQRFEPKSRGHQHSTSTTVTTPKEIYVPRGKVEDLQIPITTAPGNVQPLMTDPDFLPTILDSDYPQPIKSGKPPPPTTNWKILGGSNYPRWPEEEPKWSESLSDTKSSSKTLVTRGIFNSDSPPPPLQEPRGPLFPIASFSDWTPNANKTISTDKQQAGKSLWDQAALSPSPSIIQNTPVISVSNNNPNLNKTIDTTPKTQPIPPKKLRSIPEDYHLTATKCVVCSNLPQGISKSDINALFQDCLTDKVQILRGEDQGCCFVEFSSSEEVDKAIKKDGIRLNGQEIRVSRPVGYVTSDSGQKFAFTANTMNAKLGLPNDIPPPPVISRSPSPSLSSPSLSTPSLSSPSPSQFPGSQPPHPSTYQHSIPIAPVQHKYPIPSYPSQILQQPQPQPPPQQSPQQNRNFSQNNRVTSQPRGGFSRKQEQDPAPRYHPTGRIHPSKVPENQFPSGNFWGNYAIPHPSTRSPLDSVEFQTDFQNLDNLLNLDDDPQDDSEYIEKRFYNRRT